MIVVSHSKVSSRRALITGIRGFTGHYLKRELTEAGYEVYGIAASSREEGERIFECDLRNEERLTEIVKSIQPDVVAHLAAISFVAVNDVRSIYEVNLIGSLNLLRALSQCEKKPRMVLLISSANIYGNADRLPIAESQPPAPRNDYGVSKLAMEHMALLWEDRLPIVVARPFNYTGVGQTLDFLPAKIVDHFRRKARTIELGNLEVARDFSDVRDVVRAYRSLLEAPVAAKTFNVCSGTSHSLASMLRTMSDIAGYEINVEVNPAFVRQNEIARLEGDPSALRTAIGFFPSRPLSETLRWMYNASSQD